MKKRVLAVLMSVCLLVTSVFSLGILVSAESGYVLTELDYMINGTKMVNSYRELISLSLLCEELVYSFATAAVILPQR